MRKEQVRSLISYAQAMIEKIETSYREALTRKSIPDKLRIDVKNFMENLRSALDYMAHDIYEMVIRLDRLSQGKSEISNIYFPYGIDQNTFNSRICACLPGLNSLNSTVYDIIEAIQSYRSGDTWLYDFCKILNEKKHDKLREQKRVERRTLSIKFSNGPSIRLSGYASISGTGCISCGNSHILLRGGRISPDSPAQNASESIVQTIEVWVDFHFSGTNISVLRLLKKSIERIRALSTDVYDNL